MKLGATAFVVLSAVAAFACSSSNKTQATPSPAPASTADTGTSEETGSEPQADAATTEPQCAPPPSASKCKNDGAWIRGTARFDPSHFEAGTKPLLRVSLRHSWVLVDGEEKIGGRLHAVKAFPIKNPSAGHVTFALDMCMFGAAMWSEENDTFNLVLHIDENDNNDVLTASSNEEAVTVGTPDDGELAKIARVDVSCNAPSSCVDVTLDCEGASCTTIEPVASCKKKTPGCDSDDVFCD